MDSDAFCVRNVKRTRAPDINLVSRVFSASWKRSRPWERGWPDLNWTAQLKFNKAILSRKSKHVISRLWSVRIGNKLCLRSWSSTVWRRRPTNNTDIKLEGFAARSWERGCDDVPLASPCSPMIQPCTLFGAMLSFSLIRKWNRAVSRFVPLPITRSWGRPLIFHAT